MRDILHVILSKLTGKSADEIASILARYVNLLTRTKYERKEENLAHQHTKQKQLTTQLKPVLLNQQTGVRVGAGQNTAQTTAQQIFKFEPQVAQKSASAAPEPTKNKPRRVYAKRGEIAKGSRGIK